MALYFIDRFAAHLDYLHLICGLAWLLFGCLCRFGMDGKDRPAAGWLHAAIFTLAVAQWSRVLNESFGGSAGHALVNFYLTMAPGFLLVEYALEPHWRKGPWQSLRLLIYASLVGVAGCWMARASSENRLLIQTILILPGALATLAMLRGTNWRRSAEGRWLAPAVLGLAAYLASRVALDPFDRDLFLGLVAQPDQAVVAVLPVFLVMSQLLISLFSVFSLATYQRLKNYRQLHAALPGKPAGEDTEFFKLKTNPLNLPAAAASDVIEVATRWLMLAWLVVLVIGGAGARLAGENRAAEFRNNLLNRTALAAASIDPEWLAGLSAATNDISRPGYRLLENQLIALNQAVPDCPFVYVIRLQAGKPVFCADSHPATVPGDAYYEADPHLLAGLQPGKSFVYGPFTGHWGWSLTGFSAIPDRHPGQAPAWLGMGIQAADWNLSIAQARLVPLVGSWLLCLLLLSFSVGFQKATAATRRVTTSERRYRQMFERNPAVMLLIEPESGSLLDANPSACKFYQLSVDQLCGQNLTDLSPDSADKFLQRMHAIVTGAQDFFTARHRLGNGEMRDVEICAGPVDTGDRWVLHCIVQDVTERRHAEMELRKRELLLAGIAEAGQSLLLDKDLRQSMQTALAALGRAVGADRVYVYENHPAPQGTALLSSLLYEWTSPRAPHARPPHRPPKPADGKNPAPLGDRHARWPPRLWPARGVRRLRTHPPRGARGGFVRGHSHPD